MDKILVSKCLLGENVKYNGGNNFINNPIIKKWIDEGRLIPICPEVEGGLPVPRPASEIKNGKVVNTIGCDVTAEFMLGAHIACQKARLNDAKYALLKQSSPSCASKTVYDGTFSGVKTSGMGIAAKALSDMGVKVFDENEIEKLESLLDK